MEISINVVNQKMIPTTGFRKLVAGTQEFIRFKFYLPDEWDDLTIFAQFSQGDDSYNSYLDSDDSVYLPPEIGEGVMSVALYGAGGNVIALTEGLEFMVYKKSINENADSTEITQPLYLQLLNKIASGAPTIAETVSDMTDTSKIYLYVGSQTGYVTGAWYYHNGSDWVSGGQYGSLGVDDTLTVSNAAADAKTVGDTFATKLDTSTAWTWILDKLSSEQVAALGDDVIGAIASKADAEAVGDELTDLKADLGENIIWTGGDILSTMKPVVVNNQGVNYVKNSDGTYTVNGTAVNASFCDIYNSADAIPDGLIANKRYTIEYNASNVVLRIITYNGTTTTTLLSTNKPTTITFSEDDLSAGLVIRLFVQTGTTVSETVHPKLLLGNSEKELSTAIVNTRDLIDDKHNAVIKPNFAEPFFAKASGTLENAYILCTDFNSMTLLDTAHTGSTSTDYIPVMPGDEAIIRGRSQYSSIIYAIYDLDKNPIYVYPENASGATVVSANFEKITIPENGHYIRVSGIAIDSTAIYLKDTAILPEWINTLKESTVSGEWESETFDIENGKYLSHYSVPTSGANAALSDYIAVRPNEDILVTGKCKDSARLAAFYDADKTYIGCYPDMSQEQPDITAVDFLLTVPSSAAYIRISTVYSTTLGLKKRVPLSDVIGGDFTNGNILHKKSLYCMGDSFTAGDFTGYVDADGHTGVDSDAYSHAYGCYKTYPYWIAVRNDMDLHNLAHIGWKVSHIVNAETYKQIPENADYAFINIGLNDNSAQTPVGTIDSTDASTFYGGMNVILTWIRQNRPWLHFGIFIVSAYLGNQYRVALENLATKYGYPYLNMWTDSKVPAWMGKQGMDSTLAAELTAKAAVSDTNGHPNLECHKFISGFAEAFIRQI